MGFLCAFAAFFAVTVAARADNLALLSGTLRTYQAAGCDDNYVTLRCPQGTSIAIQVAQYGKSAPSGNLCRGEEAPTKTTSYSQAPAVNNASCLWPGASQYSLLQTVVEACQKRDKCKFQISPKTFGGDPCPGMRKYVEVAYKCRPNEFISKVACENEDIHLKCEPHSRVAIYSAKYGRTEYESVKCPQPQGVPEETCLVSYATETVMQLCHGKRNCTLSADVSTFGNPCRDPSRTYLKVVYTCVPRKVLRLEFETPLEPDEFEDEHYPTPSVSNVVRNNRSKEFPTASAKTPHAKDEPHEELAVPHFTTRSFPSQLSHQDPDSNQLNTTKDMQADEIPDPNCTITVITSERTRVIGFISEWINAYTFVSQNQERFYLYLILSVAAAIVLCLTLLVSRLLVQRRRARREAKFHATNINDNSLPNGFTDDISEIDADIDLTTSLPIPGAEFHSAMPLGGSTEVVRYPTSHVPAAYTLRRPPMETMGRPVMDPMIVEAPRSLSSISHSQQYYYG